ncbi:hypothetical protein ACQKWADRAFT_277494 [Trichoderma austrokoningii]
MFSRTNCFFSFLLQHSLSLFVGTAWRRPAGPLVFHGLAAGPRLIGPVSVVLGTCKCCSIEHKRLYPILRVQKYLQYAMPAVLVCSKHSATGLFPV